MPERGSQTRSSSASALRRATASLRALLHRRYLRAVVVPVAVSLILLSSGACLLEVRHEVSHVAVLRYFARLHLRQADLTPWVRQALTGGRLAALYEEELASFSGLVYASGDGLRFHPVAARDKPPAGAAGRLYPRLAATYLDGDLEGFLEALQSPAARHRLQREGFSPLTLGRLRRQAREAGPPQERRRVLRHAARLAAPFTPRGEAGPDPSLGDKLRFYDSHAPAGRFVGLYELVGPGLSSGPDAARAGLLASRNHYLVAARIGGGDLLLWDFYRGRRRTYRFRALDHPVRLPLFRLEPPPVRTG